jgi:pimeloyl-ACP methyl ester carboxylesterase
MKVLLLHAWPEDERMWYPQLPVVRELGLTAVTPNLYGRGPSIDGWAAQLLGELYEPVVAVGASMGGYLALALARRAPERIVGMLLAGARSGADAIDRRRFREEMISQLRTRGLPPELQESTTPAEHLASAQEAMRDRMDLSGIASSFGGPLLVCVGDEDELVSVDEARAIADSALVGSLEVFEGAGHFLTLDQPERFNVVLGDFLAQWAT